MQPLSHVTELITHSIAAILTKPSDGDEDSTQQLDALVVGGIDTIGKRNELPSLQTQLVDQVDSAHNHLSSRVR